MSFNFGSRNERYFFLCSFKSFVRWCSNFSTARNIITLACIYALCFFSSDSLTLNRLDFFNWNANQNAMYCSTLHPQIDQNPTQPPCLTARKHSHPHTSLHALSADATLFLYELFTTPKLGQQWLIQVILLLHDE